MTIGEALIPEPAADPEALYCESPAHRVSLPTYFLARYPVTVAQWRLYYEAVDQGAWTPTRPDGLACGPLDPRSLWGAATQPVAHVSWYDALDYCRWLTAELLKRINVELVVSGESRTVPKTLAEVLLHGEESSSGRPWVVTLPSEAEWEKGARGSQTAWRRPWGDEPDLGKANGRDTGILDLSAVGCFKLGRSPYPCQAEEMVGNVREWTRSLFGGFLDEPLSGFFGYPYQPDHEGLVREDLKAPESVLRTVRGGSWGYGPQYLRCSSRGWRHPDFLDDPLGFRVVVSPFRS